MKTINEYIELNPVWFDGSETTEKKVRTAIKSGKIKARKIKGAYRIDERCTVQSSNNTSSYNKLKDAYTAIRIKKEEQQLYEQKILLAEKIADVYIETYHLPQISKLTELVRKHGNEKLINLWNTQIKHGANEGYTELLEELRNVILT